MPGTTPPSIDRETFECLWAGVHRYVSRKLGLPAVADDITQDTLLEYFQRDPKIPVRCTLEYLKGIARHRAYAHFCSQDKQRQLQELEGATEITMGNYETLPEELAIKADVLARLPQEIRKLSRRQQQILICTQEGMTVNATAQKLGISYATCEKDLGMARQVLRGKLDPLSPTRRAQRRPRTRGATPSSACRSDSGATGTSEGGAR